eukprot:356382-Chlamydomonas_euryale.AAC.5
MGLIDRAAAHTPEKRHATEVWTPAVRPNCCGRELATTTIVAIRSPLPTSPIRTRQEDLRGPRPRRTQTGALR